MILSPFQDLKFLGKLIQGLRASRLPLATLCRRSAAPQLFPSQTHIA
jgi:hypothetical protein